MDRTKQLPPPAAPALPFVSRWHAPVLGGVAEILSRLADACLHPVIVLPLFFAIASDTATGIGRAVALFLAAGFLASALITPLSGERWPRLRLGALVIATALQAFILLGLGRAEEWLATNRLVLTGSALLVFIIAARDHGAGRHADALRGGADRRSGDAHGCAGHGAPDGHREAAGQGEAHSCEHAGAQDELDHGHRNSPWASSQKSPQRSPKGGGRNLPGRPATPCLT